MLRKCGRHGFIASFLQALSICLRLWVLMPGEFLCLLAEHLLLSMSIDVECCQMVLCFGGAVVGLLSFSFERGIAETRL